MNKRLGLLFFVFLYFFPILSKDSNNYHNIIRGKKHMVKAHLNNASLGGLDLNKINLTFAWIGGASFRETKMKNAKLCKCKAQKTRFLCTDLEGADLSNGDFAGAYFLGANLKKTKVKDANFKDVLGLTNDQKDYLDESGALNVPKRLTKEEFESEVKRIEEELRNRLMEFLHKILDPVFKPVGVVFEYTMTPVIKLIDYAMYPFVYPILKLDELLSKMILHFRKQQKY